MHLNPNHMQSMPLPQQFIMHVTQATTTTLQQIDGLTPTRSQHTCTGFLGCCVVLMSTVFVALDTTVKRAAMRFNSESTSAELVAVSITAGVAVAAASNVPGASRTSVTPGIEADPPAVVE